ncbi:MAG: carbohydrate binding domain-containing protein [Armatimonadota bacterium]
MSASATSAASVVLLCLTATRASAQQAPSSRAPVAWVDLTPEPTDDVLINPGMGLYLQCGPRFVEVPEDAWFLDIANIAYYRMNWSDLQPEPGPPDFDAYFKPIFDYWVGKLGGRVAFRVMCENVSSSAEYVTPKWVFDAGVPSVEHVGRRGQRQVDPVFWDERYLRLQEEFIAALGQYLDGREGFEFIDIGSIGEWGEMHLGLHIPGRWTPQQLQQTGFSTSRYIQAYRRIIDAFAQAFPHSQVFLNVGDYDAIVDYAALRGIHFRQDGLTPSGPSANVGKRFYHPYSRRGIKCNYEFHSGYPSMQKKGWALMATIDKGLEDPISYLNTNLYGVIGLADAPEEVKEALTHAARKVGFRFVVTKVRHLPQFHLDGEHPGRVVIQHAWRNDGVAPCYDSYALRLQLVGEDGRQVAEELHFPQVPTNRWWPGEEHVFRTLIRVPADAAPGRYTVKVAVVLPERPDQPPILLGIEGRDAAGRYTLCRLEGVKAAPLRATVYETGFEPGEKPWTPIEGMRADIHRAGAHSGEGCLRLTGTQADAWNYAVHQIEAPLLPFSRYRLSGWMKVERLEPKAYEPYLKCGLTDAKGNWITNHNTGRYDTKQMGTWQRLEVTFETTGQTAGGHLAVEKGLRSASIAATIYLDDVMLRLLEAP